MAQFKRTITIDVSKEELESIIKNHFKLPNSAHVAFKLKNDASNDYFDRNPRYVFSSASVTYEEKVANPDTDYQGPG